MNLPSIIMLVFLHSNLGKEKGKEANFLLLYTIQVVYVVMKVENVENLKIYGQRILQKNYKFLLTYI